MVQNLILQNNNKNRFEYNQADFLLIFVVVVENMLFRSLRTFRSSQWGRDTACRFCRFAQVFCSTRHNQSELCFCSCLSQKVLSVVRPKNDFNVFFTRSARQDTARRVPTYDENTHCECVFSLLTLKQGASKLLLSKRSHSQETQLCNCKVAKLG